MMLREPWRTRLLSASFALNLFLLGLLGMHALMPREHGPPSSDAIVEHMSRGMPPADAARFREIMRADRVQNDRARGNMEAARTELSRAIGRTPYDEAAVRSAMQAWQTAWIAWSNALGGTVVKSLPELSPDGRRSLAEAGERRPERR